jgi:N-acetylglucosamine-6-sulfatase
MISGSSRLWRAMAGLLVAGLAVGLLTAAPAVPAERSGPPNIVVIMADDMRADDMDFMPHTRSLLGQLELTEFISNHPLCCPARAEFLTGQHGHRNGVHHNSGERGGYPALLDNTNVLPAWFRQAGYATSFAGRFLPGWNSVEYGPPPGWDRATVLEGSVYRAYDWMAWRDGQTVAGDGSVHNNDMVTAESVRQIREAREDGQPFFHWAAYTAPHGYMGDDGKWLGWPVPAQRHESLFGGERPPSRAKPSYSGGLRSKLKKTHRMRLQALQSVDEGVRDIVQATQDNGTYENTVFVFTSDNGYLLGEHGLWGKNLPYEEALRVPLLARGPGVTSGALSTGGMMTDLAPSLAALAGVSPGRPQDGRADLLTSGAGWDQLLIQGGWNRTHVNEWWWRGVRDRKWTYIRWADRPAMLFNRKRDPYQVENLAGTKRAVEKRLRTAFLEVQTMRQTRRTKVNTARAAEPWG